MEASASTAAPPSSCCPPGSWPALEEPHDGAGGGSGSYLGSEVDLGNGVLAYMAVPPHTTEPASKKIGLISFPDIFRYDTDRCKGVMDQFALAGYVTVHVDFVGKDVYSSDQDLATYIKARPFDTFIKPKLVQSVIPYLLKVHNIEKFVVMGFCWGSYLALQTCADADLKDSIVAAVHFHPSLKLNAFFDETDPECLTIAQRVSCPTLLIPAGNDPDTLGPQGAVASTLQGNNAHCASVIMTDMVHGFVIRGDVSNPNVHRDVQKALQLALDFFDQHASPKANSNAN